MPVADAGVRLRSGVLEVGPDASADAVATAACRELLRQDGELGEGAVRALVEGFGYGYAPPEPLPLRAVREPAAASRRSHAV